MKEVFRGERPYFLIILDDMQKKKDMFLSKQGFFESHQTSANYRLETIVQGFIYYIIWLVKLNE